MQRKRGIHAGFCKLGVSVVIISSNKPYEYFDLWFSRLQLEHELFVKNFQKLRNAFVVVEISTSRRPVFYFRGKAGVKSEEKFLRKFSHTKTCRCSALQFVRWLMCALRRKDFLQLICSLSRHYEYAFHFLQ